MPEERYVTVQQTADELGVSRATVWRMIRDGKLPSERDPLDRRAKMIPVSALEALKRRSAHYARMAMQRGYASGPKANDWAVA